MAREINLVPDIKNEMIRALKLRNFIFFLAIVVSSASIGVTLFVGFILMGQQAVLSGKDETIKTLSAKMNSYTDLGDFLTIRDQLGDIRNLSDNKRLLSRTFNVLSAIIPTGPDTIRISELNVDLAAEAPTFNFEAQANAGQEPFIDYNVLDAFKKSMSYMKYDYGKYIDKFGNEIPAYCMIETGDDGSVFNDAERGNYAYWTIYADGCNPAGVKEDGTPREVSGADYTKESLEVYNGEKVVRIWRTPQFSQWYRKSEAEGKPYMDESGQIKNVEHFESSCTTYSAEIADEYSAPKWTTTNDNCLLVPDGEQGIDIFESSNGRGEDGELVLRFSATITFAPDFFTFNNKHMLALAPSGRHNVTDSYVQIQAMFGERASDCLPDDVTCSGGQTAPSGGNSDNNSDDTNNTYNTDDNSGSGNSTNNNNERNQNG